VVDLLLTVDHGQFAALDRGAMIDVDAYTADAQRIGLAQFNRRLVVFTESSWTSETPLRIQLKDVRPRIDLNAYDRALGGVYCATGELRIFSPEETLVNERAVRVPIGRYGVVAAGDSFGQTDEHGDDGADRYELWLWPTDDLLEPEGLKPGSTGVNTSGVRRLNRGAAAGRSMRPSRRHEVASAFVHSASATQPVRR
jgi:hypothetical protein